MKDVAKYAGVSVKTVSRIINKEPFVREKTREKVEKAIKELNYHPDLSARSLRGTISYALGLVYDNPNPYYVVDMQKGALKHCRETNYGLQIHPCDSNSENIIEELIALVQQSKLAGLILAPPMSEREDIVNALLDNGITFVRIVSTQARDINNVTSIILDDKNATQSVIEHLIELGHQRIAFLWGDAEHGSSIERYNGYKSALQKHGIKENSSQVLQGCYSFDSGFERTEKLLNDENMPSAIFGSNDEIAAGAIAAVRAKGLQVPENVSVAGFEDSPFAQQSRPPMTTAHQSIEDMAYTAAKMLVNIIRPREVDSQDETTNNIFVPQLIIRASTMSIV